MSNSYCVLLSCTSAAFLANSRLPKLKGTCKHCRLAKVLFLEYVFNVNKGQCLTKPISQIPALINCWFTVFLVMSLDIQSLPAFNQTLSSKCALQSCTSAYISSELAFTQTESHRLTLSLGKSSLF